MCAVPSNAVFWSILNSMFGDMKLMYSFSPLHTVPSAPTTNGIVRTFFKFQHFWVSIFKSLYLTIFSASFLTTFLHVGIDMSIKTHDLFSVSCMVMSGLLQLTFLSVVIATSHIMISFPAETVSRGVCVNHDLETFITRSLSIHQCTYLATWLCQNVYCVPASILQPETIWCTVSFCSLHSRHLVHPPVPQIFDVIYLVAKACSCATHSKLSVSNCR